MNTVTVTDRLTRFEGLVDHMYQDTAGIVSAARGKALFTLEDALRLPWIVAAPPGSSSEWEQASAEAIAKDYAAIKGAPRGQKAAAYGPFCMCLLTMASMNAITAADIALRVAQIKTVFPFFESLPEPGQEALFDMAYNLGLSRLHAKYPVMLQAVKIGDWETAEKECWRHGISDARNEEIADLWHQCGAMGKGN